MGFLLDAVTQEQFEVQRETVKNERGQRVDNQPYGRASETMMQNLYPPEHPYSWPVIGWPRTWMRPAGRPAALLPALVRPEQRAP
jgi:predicted Zn-dependent peptidase